MDLLRRLGYEKFAVVNLEPWCSSPNPGEAYGVFSKHPVFSRGYVLPMTDPWDDFVCLPTYEWWMFMR